MNLFFEEHQEILKLLNENGIKYLLIGGYAVIAHGYKRTTGDLDLWIEPNNDNKMKLCKALKSDGFDASEINKIEKEDFTKPFVFSIGTVPIKIDFLTKVNLIEFDEAYSHCIFGEYDDIKIPILHLNDLVLTKINTGRPKDAADIDELQRISSRK